MKNKEKKISRIGWVILLLPLALTNCSSFSRKAVIRNVAIGAASGFAAGALSKPENKAEWGLLYGGATGVSAAVATALLSDGSVEEENDRLREEKKALEEKLRVFDHGSSPSSAKVIRQNGLVGFSKELPSSVKNMIRPGEWVHEKYENNWVMQDENRVVKECEAVTFIPPQMAPSNN